MLGKNQDTKARLSVLITSNENAAILMKPGWQFEGKCFDKLLECSNFFDQKLQSRKALGA